MSLLRREPTRTDPTPPLPENDPDLGFFRRRALRIKRLGIRTIGPVSLNPPAPEPTRADAVVAAKRDSEVRREHHAMITAELKAVDDHAHTLEQRLTQLAGGASFESQESHAELRQLGELRVMIAADLNHPIRTDRHGRQLDDHMRGFIRFRTRELAEQLWANAELAARSGDHRRARQLRRDALRARHLAEHEMHLRGHLPGYGISPWS
jgi:hypothetical protein